MSEKHRKPFTSIIIDNGLIRISHKSKYNSSHFIILQPYVFIYTSKNLVFLIYSNCKVITGGCHHQIENYTFGQNHKNTGHYIVIILPNVYYAGLPHIKKTKLL